MQTSVPSIARGLTRRQLLRRGGLALGGIAVAGSGALAYRAYDQGVFSTEHGPAYTPWDDWREGAGMVPLVRAAILAPSPHNAQAWRFGLGEGFVDVHADRSRATGALDPLLRELHVGLGAAVENMVLAARATEHQPHVLLLPSGDRSDHVAHVAFTAGRSRPSSLAEQIPHRHTNRYPYVDKPVPSALLARLSGLVDPSVPDVRLIWLTSRPQRELMGEILVAATAAILDDADQRISDARWFRQSWDEIQARRDGITIDTAGLPDLTTAAAKLLPARSPAATGEAWLDATRTRHTRTAAAYGIVTVRDAGDVVQQLQGGRLLQRVHLAATGEGLALHHMNQITERADREHQLGLPPEFGRALELLVPRGWQALASFRVGFPTRAARRSPRRPMTEVVLP